MMRDLFAEELDALHARSLDRHLREITGAQGSEIEIAGRRFINFSSNDYLGLANDPRLRFLPQRGHVRLSQLPRLHALHRA